MKLTASRGIGTLSLFGLSRPSASYTRVRRSRSARYLRESYKAELTATLHAPLSLKARCRGLKKKKQKKRKEKENRRHTTRAERNGMYTYTFVTVLDRCEVAPGGHAFVQDSRRRMTCARPFDSERYPHFHTPPFLLPSHITS